MGMELENRMVSAEWLKDKFYEICDEHKCSVVFIDRIIDEIDDAPDVEVVRCKDCRHYVWDEFDGAYVCISLCKYVKPDFWCANGERKDNA